MIDPEEAEGREHMNVNVKQSQTKDMTRMVAAATDEDTLRATRTMSEQMDAIVYGLEREIGEAEAVKLTVIRRIDDLNLAKSACIAAKAVLK